jgi:phosphate transport system ATP-binding protein
MSTQAGPAQPGDVGGVSVSPAGSQVVTGQVTSGQAAVEQAAASGGSAILSAVDLTLSFGQRAILSDVNTEIRRGVVTALIGPTGSGKSTLLRTLNRMNDKVTGYRHAGDVLLDGRSIWSPLVELMTLRRKVGMLFQRPNPFPMSIMDNVTAGTRAHKMVPRSALRNVAEEHLTEVGLWDAVKDRLKDSPFRLSGGQQQLLCLARALAVKPDVLLLDEPTSALDPNATESIEALIRTLVPNLTVVIVTHNLAQAVRVSDRTMFLYQGRLVEHGETKQVFENSAHEETARYVAGRFG